MTAALEGGEWSAERPGRNLPPGKTRYPLYRRLGRTQGRSGEAENLVPTGIRSRTVQPVAQSLYRLSYPTHSHQDTFTILLIQYEYHHSHRHQADLDRPARPRLIVSSRPSKSPPSIWSIIQHYIWHPLLLVLFKCRSQFGLYLLRLS